MIPLLIRAERFLIYIARRRPRSAARVPFRFGALAEAFGRSTVPTDEFVLRRLTSQLTPIQTCYR